MMHRQHPHEHSGPTVIRTVRNILISVARPNPLVLAWRWRYELGLLGGLPAGALVLQRHLCACL
jgi:hypothetical protein